MKRLIFSAFLLTTTAAGGQSIPADVASGKRTPKATFEDLHKAFTRIVLNESGWSSRPDMNGLLQVFLTNTGGRRRTHADTFGLDYDRMVLFAARASLRTFPATDPWAEAINAERYGLHGEVAIAHHVERQQKLRNTRWTSSFNMDCSEPGNWAQVYPGVQWAGFQDRCLALVESTRQYLQGKEPNWCRTFEGETASPRYWGCDQDVHRADKENWEELLCDEPGTSCSGADRKDPNNKSCARNRWFRWPVKNLTN